MYIIILNLFIYTGVWVVSSQLFPPNQQDMPIFILQEDRRYTEMGYTANMGAYPDLIPILLGISKFSDLARIVFQSIHDITKL